MRQDPEEPRPTEAYWPPLPPRERRRRRGGTGLAIIVVLVAAGIGAAATVFLERDSSPAPSATGTTAGLDVAAVTSKVEAGMVDITVRDTYSGLVAEGTGLILSSDGLVVTNNHVISGSTSVRVTAVVSGRTYRARVLGYDSADDVALLRLTGASGLRVIATGNSTRVNVGQPVLALGNARGRDGLPTASTGTVTALDQTITPANTANGSTETLHGVLATSAPVTAGDSGGALADAAGHVIGIITASASGPNGNVSGYAIPVNSALRIARLISSGQGDATVQIGAPAFLGISVTNSPGSCGELGGGLGADVAGAKVCVVYPGTPAAWAGLRAGDVITSAGGQAVTSASGLAAITGRLRPGATLSVSYADISGHSRSIHLTLTAGPPE
jgi:S1-C subfamily serine protease